MILNVNIAFIPISQEKTRFCIYERVKMIKAEKQKHILNLMVLAINEALKKGVINLEVAENEERKGYLLMDVAGKPSVFNWFDAGYGELRISIWWDYHPEMMPTYRRAWLTDLTTSTPPVNRKYFRNIMGACGTCYLERRSGRFIIGDMGNQFTSTYIREDSAFELARLRTAQPDGYEICGRISE